MQLVVSCDLLYASKLVITPETIAPQPEKVTLQFAHLLSKLKFTFTNAFTNANTSIKVKNITITDAPGEGVIALN
ncbi:MAG: fimbrillin family protein, partial [Alistipes sp.]|nr:fimbrillin family protein [Alistipes sp.]